MKVKKVAEKSLNQLLKQKSCWKICKPAVESKKIAEKSENGGKQKSCWKIFKPAVESKKVLKNLKTSGWKQKMKNYISFVDNVNVKLQFSGWTNCKFEIKKVYFLFLWTT